MMLTQHLNSSNYNGKYIDIGKAMLKRSLDNYLAGKLLILSQIIINSHLSPVIASCITTWQQRADGP